MATFDIADTITSPTVKRTLMVARQDGRLYRVDFSENPQLDDPGLIDWDISISKILIGKFQMSRTRWVTLEELEFENTTHSGVPPVGATSDLEVTVFNSLDGKTPEIAPVPVVVHESDGLIKLNTRVTGNNFSVQLRGTYNLNTLVLTTHNNGRR